MVFHYFSHRARLMESADPYRSKWLQKSKTAAQILLEILRTNIARSNALNILYSKYLMAINKLHNSFHRSIKVSLILFAFSSAMNSHFPQAMKVNCECFTLFILIGRAYLIQLLHILTSRCSENRLRINGRKQARQK